MAHLPRERFIDPFSFIYCWMDVLRTFIIKGKRSESNLYAALFTYFLNRAFHIEITSSLYDDSFIIALWRFMSSWGLARSIWSQHGSSFVGANNELKWALKEIKHEKIKLLNKRRVEIGFCGTSTHQVHFIWIRMRMSNLLWKIHFEKIVWNTQSFIEKWISSNTDDWGLVNH